jgi:VanZ family protein
MLRRALASPHLWLFAVILWALALYMLSALPSVAPIEGPEIPHIDKVMHFGYFMGGAFLFTTHLLLKHGLGAHSIIRVVTPILFFAFIGALDEYHQTFTPGRSGNDTFDWMADLLGASMGTHLANVLHPLLLKISSPISHSVKNYVH